jgi:YesN/AraC family two-component response regulator
MDGIALLKAAQEIDSTLEAIVTTGHGTIDSAVRAMKAGAFDFIVKPFKLNVILPVISRVLDIKRLHRENAALRERVESEDRASAVMAHAAIGMALVDATGSWLKVNAADGSVDYFVSQIQDISARKEMDRIKREFISTMSHELRTPLTSIRAS